jgi:hypothetical protein
VELVDPMVTELLGPLVNIIQNCLGLYSHRRQAEIQIASDLRQWMSRCEEMVSDIDTWQNSDRAGGSAYYELPEFSFENSMDLVAKLDKKNSVSILDLIHNKNDANTVISAAIDHWADEDDAATLTRDLLAKIFLQVEPIHRGLAKNIGWNLSPYNDQQIERMQQEVARTKKAEQDAAASAASLFDELGSSGS